MNVRLEELQESDLPFVKEVYDYYTLQSTAVYSIKPVSIEDIRSFLPVRDPVYRSYIIKSPGDETIGFCYFNKFKPREAYRISVELTIYFKQEFTGRGYGRDAMKQMEEIIKAGGFHNIVALVGGENEASIRLFEKCGYACCAHIKEAAEKFGRKLDLIIYQKITGCANNSVRF
ncbi:MAG: GNAT family N-acetyltransferase [Mediterranea sp.]|jgi:phosphinothricin acetyltransferase|nr:GNAT family N-acetyltransferase [Mediterranea sp.]